MFSRVTLYFGLLLTAVVLLLGISLGRVSHQEVDAMRHTLLAQKLSKDSSCFSSTNQQRDQVTKEIWLSQPNHTRLHHRICSEHSSLTLVPLGSRIDLIETLNDVTCWIQDKLSVENNTSAWQQMRLLRAKEGLYQYSSQQLVAQSVEFSIFKLPSHDLPLSANLQQTPFLQGIADDVNLSISGKNPQFKAEQFKAELHSLEKPL